MTDTAETTCPAQAFVDACLDNGIKYEATFVPQSRSRNANETDDRSNLIRSLNWRVVISKAGCMPLVTDYTQGIGHKPGYKVPWRCKTLIDVAHETSAAERGVYFLGQGSTVRHIEHGRGKRLPAPKFVDVLHCLVMDADALEYPTFEEWASNYDYDTDSRKAEGIYRACLDTALKLRQMIDLDEAREAFQDY